MYNVALTNSQQYFIWLKLNNNKLRVKVGKICQTGHKAKVKPAQATEITYAYCDA